MYTLDRDTDEDGIYDETGYTTLRRIPGRVAAGQSSGGWARADISNDGRYVAFTQPDLDNATSCLRAFRYGPRRRCRRVVRRAGHDHDGRRHRH